MKVKKSWRYLTPQVIMVRIVTFGFYKNKHLYFIIALDNKCVLSIIVTMNLDGYVSGM